MTIDVNAESFENEVIQSKKPVLVDFWGPRCEPCLALMPQVEALEQKYENKIKITTLDASKNRRFCLTLKVLGLPTYLFYKDGKEVERLTGGDLAIRDIEASIRKIIEK
jgi:thioredoxin 1